MSRRVATDGSGRPDWRVPALRTGLEVVLIGLIAAYLAVHLSSPLLVALVAVAAAVGSLVLVFRTADQQAYDWVRYASNRAQQSQRKRRRKRERREQRQQQQQRQRDSNE